MRLSRLQSNVAAVVGFSLWHCGLIAGVPAPAGAETFNVTRTDDPAPGACAPEDCSLREAVVAANENAGADTIFVPAGLYALSRPGVDDDGLVGDLDILDAVTLVGAGAFATFVDAGGIDRVFEVLSPASALVELTALYISSGDAFAGGGVRNAGTLELSNCAIVDNDASVGGGIANSDTGILTVERCTLFANVAGGPDGSGGGIASYGVAQIIGSTIEGNSAAASGGGLFLAPLTVTTIERSTLAGNDAGSALDGWGGGGILSFGTLTISASLIAGNQATLSDGGGANLRSFAMLRNVTFSDNSADSEGGGIFLLDNLAQASNVTIHSNTAMSGGGIWSGAAPISEIRFRHSIVASNTGGNCVGNVVSSSPWHNLDSGATCGFDGAGDLSNTDPLLGPLADNGGPTATHALDPASPAVDAGDAVVGCVTETNQPLTADQRGAPRPWDGDDDGTVVCDMGAFELGLEPIFADGFESGDTSAWSSAVP